jgi:DNA-binding NtrC family response regulator
MQQEMRGRVDEQNVLVVDDEPSVLQICSRALSNVGYTVFAASNAERARYYIDREELDLVILDIHMPDEDGISLLRYVHNKKPSTVTMLMTGYPAVSTVIDSIRLNVSEYLCKPFTLPKLLAAVKSSLRDREPQA